MGSKACATHDQHQYHTFQFEDPHDDKFTNVMGTKEHASHVRSMGGGVGLICYYKEECKECRRDSSSQEFRREFEYMMKNLDDIIAQKV